jgi:hypothetical protein
MKTQSTGTPTLKNMLQHVAILALVCFTKISSVLLGSHFYFVDENQFRHFPAASAHPITKNAGDVT